MNKVGILGRQPKISARRDLDSLVKFVTKVNLFCFANIGRV